MQPGQNVALTVQHTPHIDMVVLIDIQAQAGVARQRPEAQATAGT